MLNIAAITPELAKYGGAEKYLLQCVARWQHDHRITLYATQFDERLLAEAGVGDEVARVTLSPYFECDHSIVLNCVLLPKVWEQEIARHDVYVTNLWPTHLIDLHPMVWIAHEPLRALRDLRYSDSIEELAESDTRLVHVYPKFSYDRVSNPLREAYFNALAQHDRAGRPDRVVTNSRYTAGYLQEVYDRRITDVVYPGVTAEDFALPADASPDQTPNVVVTIGQLWPHKRIDRIIESIALVDGVELQVIGVGPERRNLGRMADALGVSDRVVFRGNVEEAELQGLLAGCLAVVFMPIREPFGIVALEALAAGKPLIASGEGGFTEVVDESCAMLVPALPERIAECIERLREDAPLRRRMGEAGRRRAADYGWDRTARELLAIVEQTEASWRASRRPVGSDGAEADTLFGVQYFCWYGEGLGSRHWNDVPRTGAVTDMPALGYYASARGSTLEAHLEALEAMGLDFAVLNLHVDAGGVNPFEWAAIENLFGLAERSGTPLRFAVQVCPYDCSDEDLVATLGRIDEKLADRAPYLALAGRPVLFVFWTGVRDGERRWIEMFREATARFVCIGSSQRLYDRRSESRKTFGMFDGLHLFSPLELARPQDRLAVWQQAYANADAGNLDLRIVSLSPGYDDRALDCPQREGNPRRAIDRADGGTYREMMDFALALPRPPDLVIVSTFNEYHENTHIEASRNHGDRYERMTRDFVKVARHKWRGARVAAVRA